MSNKRSKRCLRCKEPKPIKRFGRDRCRPDKRNPYCKECVLIMVHAYRDRKRAMKKANKEALTRAQEKAQQEIAEFDRKPNVLSPILHKPISRVLSAVKEGHRTRDEIKKATGLGLDDIGDALAELAFDRHELRLVKVGDETEFHSIAA